MASTVTPKHGKTTAVATKSVADATTRPQRHRCHRRNRRHRRRTLSPAILVSAISSSMMLLLPRDANAFGAGFSLPDVAMYHSAMVDAAASSSLSSLLQHSSTAVSSSSSLEAPLAAAASAVTSFLSSSSSSSSSSTTTATTAMDAVAAVAAANAAAGSGASVGSAAHSDIVGTVIPRLFDAYRSALAAHPLSTNLATGAALAALGDAVAQRFQAPPPAPVDAEGRADALSLSRYDVRRASSFVAFDASYRAVQFHLFPLLIELCRGDILGPAFHRVLHIDIDPFWYATLERSLANQLIVVPLLYYPLFFALTGLVQGLSTESTLNRARETFVPLMKRNLAFWIPIQIVQFGFVEESLQIPFLCAAGLVWTVILSVKAGSTSTYCVTGAEDACDIPENVFDEMKADYSFASGAGGGGGGGGGGGSSNGDGGGRLGPATAAQVALNDGVTRASLTPAPYSSYAPSLSSSSSSFSSSSSHSVNGKAKSHWDSTVVSLSSSSSSSSLPPTPTQSVMPDVAMNRNKEIMSDKSPPTTNKMKNELVSNMAR